MKKTILSLSVALSAFMASADTVTNYVYVISNQYFRQVREVTNRVSTVTYKTNVTVRVDVSDAAIARAEYEADRAERAVSNATSIAEAAASSASDAASSASAAYSSERSAQSAVSDGLQRINERINWFDQHSGETITQINSNITIIVQDGNVNYMDSSGVRYENIMYYYQAVPNGKVAVSGLNSGASIQYRVVPCYNANLTPTKYWIFEPAYVDSDVNGMRLHYLPTTTNMITSTQHDVGCNYLPRDFFWQNGKIWFVMDCYSGMTWRGRLRMTYVGTDNPYMNRQYPNPIYADRDGNAYTSSGYDDMKFDSKEGIIYGSISSSSYVTGKIKTEYQKTMPSRESILWFPEKFSVGQKPIVDWLSTFLR